MDDKRRTEIYLRQTGRRELTGKQAKRLRQKENRRIGSGGGSKKK